MIDMLLWQIMQIFISVHFFLLLFECLAIRIRFSFSFFIYFDVQRVANVVHINNVEIISNTLTENK